ncbi:hypothetical protein ABN028_19835 [Actinopolymorpha sp. B17G11]|uniref:hypothetical protein n=1 Tax=Actinopolymorpha sp. B17G11 TaxID=3160861 RepID=UPI0032E3EF42
MSSTSVLIPAFCEGKASFPTRAAAQPTVNQRRSTMRRGRFEAVACPMGNHFHVERVSTQRLRRRNLARQHRAAKLKAA